jgi:acyl-coenzyme A thioesterase PaaI-like protein
LLARPSVHLVRRTWDLMRGLPAGRWAFSRLLGFYVPYSGTTGFLVDEIADGRAVVRMQERPGIRNHLDSIHALALANVGELTTGLAVHSSLPAHGRAILLGLTVRFVKKARGGVVSTCSVGIPPEAGRHDVEATAEVRDAAGDVVTTVTAVWRVER